MVGFVQDRDLNLIEKARALLLWHSAANFGEATTRVGYGFAHGEASDSSKLGPS